MSMEQNIFRKNYQNISQYKTLHHTQKLAIVSTDVTIASKKYKVREENN